MPLGFCSFFVSRNMLLRNCMDRIYYSSEHVYKKVRSSDSSIAPTKTIAAKENDENVGELEHIPSTDDDYEEMPK